MKYTVLWTPPAEQHLATIWMAAPNRAAVALAAKSLDDQLSESAHLCGESRWGDFRVTFAPPLGIEFKVLEKDRIVYVVGVWSFEKGTSSS